MIVAGGVAGGLLGFLAWVLCRAAALGDRRVAAVPPPAARREVGTCGACGGPIMLDQVSHKAACPCGACVLPERFLRQGVAP